MLGPPPVVSLTCFNSGCMLLLMMVLHHQRRPLPSCQPPNEIHYRWVFEGDMKRKGRSYTLTHTSILCVMFTSCCINVYQAWHDRPLQYAFEIEYDTNFSIQWSPKCYRSSSFISLFYSAESIFFARFTLSKIHRVDDNKVWVLGVKDGTYCNTHIGAAEFMLTGQIKIYGVTRRGWIVQEVYMYHLIQRA